MDLPRNLNQMLIVAERPLMATKIYLAQIPLNFLSLQIIDERRVIIDNFGSLRFTQ